MFIQATLIGFPTYYFSVLKPLWLFVSVWKNNERFLVEVVDKGVEFT